MFASKESLSDVQVQVFTRNPDIPAEILAWTLQCMHADEVFSTVSICQNYQQSSELIYLHAWGGAQSSSYKLAIQLHIPDQTETDFSCHANA